MNKTALFWFLLVGISSLASQEVPTPATAPAASTPSKTTEPAEAPEALLDTKIGDADFVMTAMGTWTSRLLVGWGEGITPLGSIGELGYPGFEKGLIFSQTPDFSVRLELMKRYYFELAYQGGFDKSSFLLGYQGQEGEFLQWAKFGNAPVTVPSVADQIVPVGRKGNLAFGMSVATENTTHDLLVRYEDNQQVHKFFLGTRPLDSDIITLDQWVRGRFFQIPSTSSTTAPFPGLAVLIQDPNGSINTGTYVPSTGAPQSLENVNFRPATVAEAYVDPSLGVVRLPAATTKVLLATWAGAPASVTDPVSGSVYNAVTIQGSKYFVFNLPGAYSPFEAKDHYALPAGFTGIPQITLLQKGTGKVLYTKTLSWSQGQDWFTVQDLSSPTQPPFFSEYYGLYAPFNNAPPGLDSLLKEELQVQASSTSTPNTLNIGPGALAGSVTVLRNGIPQSGVDLNPATGDITLDTPIFDTDQIEVIYQKDTDYTSPTDIYVFQGNTWTINKEQSLEWAESFRWNLQQGRFTTADLQSPGSFQTSTLWTGTSGPWNWSTELRAGALLSDSTGYRQLYGMDETAITTTLDSNSLRPSGAAGTLTGLTPTLTQSNRALTYFRDYWTTDPLSGTPSLSNYQTPNIGQQTYGDGGWMGPYLVQGDDTRTDRLVVIEASMNTNEWTGASGYFSQGKVQDYSGVTQAKLNIRLPQNLPAGSRVFFQVGALGDNLDGTGVAGTSSVTSRIAFSFQDSNPLHSGKLNFPTPEGSAWTDDANGNGVLSPDGDLVTLELTGWGKNGIDNSNSNDLNAGTDIFHTTDGTNTWQALNLRAFTASEQVILKQATGWRLVVVSQSISGQAVVLLSNPEFDGTNWTATPAAAGTSTITAREIAENEMTSSVTKTLSSQFSEVGSVFLSGGATQKVLEVPWSASGWTLNGRQQPLSYQGYGKVVFYYRLPTSVGATTLNLSFLDPNQKGATVVWPVTQEATVWHKAVLDLKNKNFSVDGAVAAPLQVDSTSGPWDHVVITQTGAASGLLYLAEIHAEDPIWQALTTGIVKGGWQQTESVSFAGIPLVSSTHVSTTTQASWTSAGSTGQDTKTWSGASDIVTNLLGSRWKIDALVQNDGTNYSTHGAYEVVVPLGPLEAREKFSDLGLRSEGATVQIPWLGTVTTDANVQGPPVSLQQTYTATWFNWFSPLLPQGWNSWTDFKLQENWNEQIPLDSFGQQWQESYSWLAPRTDVAPYTLLQTDGRFAVPPSPWGFGADWQVQSLQTQGSPWLSGPLGQWNLNFPYDWGESGNHWEANIEVSRKLNIQDQTADGLPFTDLTSRSFDRLFSVPNGILGVPFLELFQSGSVFDGQPSELSTGALESDLLLTLQRPRGITWEDLVYPLSSTLGFKSIETRQNLSDLWYQEVSSRFQTQALNLFGEQGSNPLFHWFQTDQYSWSLTSKISQGNGPTDDAFTLGTLTDTKVFLTSNESVGLPTRFDATWSTVSTTAFEITPTWNITTPANLPFELPRWLSPGKFSRVMIQTLSTTLGFGADDLGSPLFQKLLIEYQFHIKLSDKSEFVYDARWGNQWQKDLYLIGLETSVNLILSF